MGRQHVTHLPPPCLGEYSLNSDEWDIYELSDSLKLFLRELKEPLLSHALYNDLCKFCLAAFDGTRARLIQAPTPPLPLLVDFSSTLGNTPTADNVARMRSFLQKLPECHYATTRMLFEHLNK